MIILYTKSCPELDQIQNSLASCLGACGDHIVHNHDSDTYVQLYIPSNLDIHHIHSISIY